ncbi:MAG TPA: ABC transporter permease, partial [Pseudomonadales bacterium]|nr:ABC transporter permease [Pseudomonadales bacterium]
DASAVSRLDTSGALLLLRALRSTGVPFAEHRVTGLDAADRALLELVAERVPARRPAARQHSGLTAMLARIGVAVVDFWRDTREFLGFVGLVLVSLVQVLTGRRTLRLTSTVFHMEQVGLDAVPIVALLTFLVGAVVAFVGATALRDLGAEIFTVELVSVSFLREFAVLLTAILLAGRSGSAFAAQIGSMKSREELDAIATLGLDAVELLVIPRVLALMVMLPLLMFVAMWMGIFGGGFVSVLALDITPGMFVARLQETTEVRHFMVGLVKAPVFAFLIGTVGCLEGFKVEGSAESVGRHTTSAVVQSIFLVIVFDALFAMCFMQLGI